MSEENLRCYGLRSMCEGYLHCYDLRSMCEGYLHCCDHCPMCEGYLHCCDLRPMCEGYLHCCCHDDPNLLCYYHFRDVKFPIEFLPMSFFRYCVL